MCHSYDKRNQKKKKQNDQRTFIANKDSERRKETNKIFVQLLSEFHTLATRLKHIFLHRQCVAGVEYILNHVFLCR